MSGKEPQPLERIAEFIAKHHVMTLATVAGGNPWCCNLFYAYLKEDAVLVFTSSADTRHAQEFTAHPTVAGSIVLETKTVGLIQGLQFSGNVQKPDNDLLGKARKAYLRRFPYAVFMDMELWTLEIDTLKLTDNRLGFGKKLHWERQK